MTAVGRVSGLREVAAPAPLMRISLCRDVRLTAPVDLSTAGEVASGGFPPGLKCRLLTYPWGPDGQALRDLTPR